MTSPSPSFNNTYIIEYLDDEDSRAGAKGPKPRPVIRSGLCLAERLPSTAFIRREAERLIPLSVVKQLKRAIEEEELELSPAVDEESEGVVSSSPTPSSEHPLPASPGGTIKANFLNTMSKVFKATGPGSPANSSAGGPWKEPQPWEILKAIERKDIMFLMEIRDKAFHLLLRRTGDGTPLLHAMRIGQTHRDVAILLVGAFSRYVNNLEDDEMDKPRTKTILKALRGNLKLAIDNSLAIPNQSDLIASFLQTLVMSEGDRWLVAQVQQVAIALRAKEEDSRPVQVADEAVRKFATRELGKSKGLIAAVDDYVANATADLLMMASWSLVMEKIPDGEMMPTYTFARDDRTYKAFTSRLVQNKLAIRATLGKRLRWQLAVLEKVFEDRQQTLRRKVDIVQGEFDAPAATT